jgi:crotonobetainyl-CoA:carnitine CoA-transferase CaiB-like acyl-CoA transferase
MSYSHPYSGLQILDLSQGVAMPHCAMLFAQFGADVVKVEPPGGDWSRTLGKQYGEQSALSVAYNLGKRSVVLDLKTPQGVEAALALAQHCDVLMESFRPGVLERLGLGYERVRQLNRRVVYASVSGFGQQGPHRDRPCSDTLAQAFSGFMSINRGRDGIPHKVNTIIMDSVTGVYAFGVVQAALAGRGDGDEGCYLDLSLAGCAAAIQSAKFLEHTLEGGTPTPLNVPAGTYRTADGWIALTLTKDIHFAKLCEGIGLPELAEDPRHATFAGRAEHEETLVARIAERMLARDTAQWCALLQAADVLAENVMSHGEWLDDAHVTATSAAPAVSVPGIGELRLPATPGRDRHHGDPPGIGEHTLEVLAELGMDPDRLHGLALAGALGPVHARKAKASADG